MEYTIEHNRIQQFGTLEFIAKQVVEGFIVGLHKSPFHGFSVEFAEHRLYNTGESIKHIDWKLYGRTDKMFIKRYEEETNLRCQLILDISSSMYFPVMEKISLSNPNKITFAVHAAAALIYLFKKQRDALWNEFVQRCHRTSGELPASPALFIRNSFILNLKNC